MLSPLPVGFVADIRVKVVVAARVRPYMDCEPPRPVETEAVGRLASRPAAYRTDPLNRYGANTVALVFLASRNRHGAVSVGRLLVARLAAIRPTWFDAVQQFDDDQRSSGA